MNNTFDFNRFKNLLLKDGKMYIRNYGTGLIVVCCLNAIFWIFNLLFGTSSESEFRFGMICVWTALAMMMVPEKVYGKANLSREGVGFAMLPASSLEKFVSMFLYCAIVTPVIVFFGGYLVDTLLSLFPFGGFEESIDLFTHRDLAEMINNSDGVVQSSNEGISFTDVFPIGVLYTTFYVCIIQWAAIFMLGNMIFKKHKAGKTFACYLGISYVLSTIIGAVLMTSRNRLEQWFENMDSVPESEMIQFVHNGTICGMVVAIVITALLLFFTYRKIKTQKY